MTKVPLFSAAHCAVTLTSLIKHEACPQPSEPLPTQCNRYSSCTLLQCHKSLTLNASHHTEGTGEHLGDAALHDEEVGVVDIEGH